MASKSWKDMHHDATTTIKGDFSFVVDSAEPALTQGGKDMIKCKMIVESGPFAGRAIWHNFTISPESSAAMRIFFSQMAVLGLGAKYWDKYPDAPMEQVAAALKDRRFEGRVGTREWQGAEREQIEEFKPPKGAATARANATAGATRGTVGSGPSRGSLPATEPADAVPAAVAREVAQPSEDAPEEPAF